MLAKQAGERERGLHQAVSKPGDKFPSMHRDTALTSSRLHHQCKVKSWPESKICPQTSHAAPGDPAEGRGRSQAHVPGEMLLLLITAQAGLEA